MSQAALLAIMLPTITISAKGSMPPTAEGDLTLVLVDLSRAFVKDAQGRAMCTTSSQPCRRHSFQRSSKAIIAGKSVKSATPEAASWGAAVCRPAARTDRLSIPQPAKSSMNSTPLLEAFAWSAALLDAAARGRGAG